MSQVTTTVTLPVETVETHAGPSQDSTQQASTSSHRPPQTETITLRLVPRRKKQAVKWTDDTMEVNEFMGKKKSKKCCIFHKQNVFGDWSDDDDSGDECDGKDCKDPEHSTNGPVGGSDGAPGQGSAVAGTS